MSQKDRCFVPLANALGSGKKMGYQIRRTDANQKAVVARFRKLGAKVLILSQVGNGVPDIAIGLLRSNSTPWCAFVEIKDGSKFPSQRKLTPDEQKFHDEWEGFVHIINNEQDVDLLVEWVRGL
jgi:hypothetical protein